MDDAARIRNEFAGLVRHRDHMAGQAHKRRYNVSEGLVTVAAWRGTHTAPLGILPAERLAKMLLRELASWEQEK